MLSAQTIPTAAKEPSVLSAQRIPAKQRIAIESTIEEQLAERNRERNIAEDKLNQKDATIEKLQKGISAMETRRVEVEGTLLSERKKLADLESQLTNATGELEGTKAELKKLSNLEKRVNSLEKELEDADICADCIAEELQRETR